MVLSHVVKAIRLPQMIHQIPPIFQRALENRGSMGSDSYERDIEDETPQELSTEALSWLWSSCVQPILQALETYDLSVAPGDIPRIWWIGTGISSSLPFHAAGVYGNNLSDNCLQRCIPSYIPTVKTLKHARTLRPKDTKLGSEKISVLVVTMPTTPGTFSTQRGEARKRSHRKHCQRCLHCEGSRKSSCTACARRPSRI